MNFYIIYPQGNRSKLKVAELDEYDSYDYALASRKTFYDKNDACDYAKELAVKHVKEYVVSHDEDYLD